MLLTFGSEPSSCERECDILAGTQSSAKAEVSCMPYETYTFFRDYLTARVPGSATRS